MRKFILLFFALIFCCCGDKQVINDLDKSFTLESDHKRGDPLKYSFKVRWNKFNSGYVRLTISPGSNGSPEDNIDMGSINVNYGNFSVDYTFSDNNPSPTTYYCQAGIRSEPNGGGTTIWTSNQLPITIEYKKFRLIQLQMVNNNLWPSYTSGSTNYNGIQKRNEAFGDANTVIRIIQNISNLSTQVDFSSKLKLLYWTIQNAGGNTSNPPYYSLDRDVAILCAVVNIPNNIDPTYPYSDDDHGFTWRRDNQLPSMAYIRYDKIKLSYSAPYDFARAATGVSIHELGHSRGIAGDDPLGGLIPPHGGNNSSVCTMRSPYNISWFINPVFCDDHIIFLKTVTW